MSLTIPPNHLGKSICPPRNFSVVPTQEARPIKDQNLTHAYHRRGKSFLVEAGKPDIRPSNFLTPKAACSLMSKGPTPGTDLSTTGGGLRELFLLRPSLPERHLSEEPLTIRAISPKSVIF